VHLRGGRSRAQQHIAERGDGPALDGDPVVRITLANLPKLSGRRQPMIINDPAAPL
jgi:hypothetical protein